MLISTLVEKNPQAKLKTATERKFIKVSAHILFEEYQTKKEYLHYEVIG